MEMIEWLKQQYNNLIFELFPILPSYLVRDCYKEFDEKYKEFRIMTEKRFQYNVNKNSIEYNEKHFAYCNWEQSKIAKKLNELDEKWIKELNLRETLQLDLQRVEEENKALKSENEQLKQLIKKLEKQIHLIHMASMFSTVKSFKGDVTKRYEYSEETDTIYDTANKYGQYNKILDKKEVVMLLNEYETLLKGDFGHDK
jgi:superfamily II RNA helicase